MRASAGAPLDVRTVLDRSNTNPVCPTCEYRTRALDQTRVACEHCGEVTAVTDRVVRLIGRVFGAVEVIERDDDAGS